jgi:hypothetical protein
MRGQDGIDFITLISELTDPQYYNETWVVSSHFKKVSDNAQWEPEPCAVGEVLQLEAPER